MDTGSSDAKGSMVSSSSAAFYSVLIAYSALTRAEGPMHAAAAAEYSTDGQSLIQQHLQHTLTHTDNTQIRTTIII